MKSLLTICLTFFFGTAAAMLAAEELRTWNDISGKFSVVAELLDFDGTNARLKRENGKTISVSFEKLSLKDQDYLKKRGQNDDKSEAEDNPFAGGELPSDRRPVSKAAQAVPEKSDSDGEAATPIDTTQTVIPKFNLGAWTYKPDPGPEVVLDNPVKEMVFPLNSPESGTKTSGGVQRWSDFHFNPAKPSQVFVSVFSSSSGREATGAFTRLFAADTKTGKVISTDLSRNFVLLGVSPDGEKMLFLEGPLQGVHKFGVRTKVHVYRFSDELALTRVSGFEPFRTEKVPEEKDEDEVVVMESKTRYATGSSRGTITSTMTSSPNVQEKRYDALGRLQRSSPPPGFQRGGMTENDVAWGTWADSNYILLLSQGGGCLISLDIRSGKVLWSIPGGSSGHAVLSPGKRYCLLRYGMNLNHLTDKKTLDSMKRMSPVKKIMIPENPWIVFDLKELRLRGRLEGEAIGNDPVFSPDGKTVAVPSKSSIVRWNMTDGKLLETIYYSYPYLETSGLVMPDYSVQRNQESANPFRWVNDRYVKAGSVLIDTIAEAPVWRYRSSSGDQQMAYGGYYWFGTASLGRPMKLYPMKIPHSAVPKQEQAKPDKKPYVVEEGTPVALQVEDSVVRGRQAIINRLEKTIEENGWILKTKADTVLVALVTNDPEKKLPRYEIEIRKDGRSLWRVATHPGSARLGATTPDEREIERADYSKWFIDVTIPRKIRSDASLGESDILE